MESENIIWLGPALEWSEWYEGFLGTNIHIPLNVSLVLFSTPLVVPFSRKETAETYLPVQDWTVAVVPWLDSPALLSRIQLPHRTSLACWLLVEKKNGERWLGFALELWSSWKLLMLCFFCPSWIYAFVGGYMQNCLWTSCDISGTGKQAICVRRSGWEKTEISNPVDSFIREAVSD